MIDRADPLQRPEGRPVGFQRWRRLLFLHWPVPVEILRPLLPSRLAVDTHDGRAYVGVVAFTMRDVTLAWAPSIPGFSSFHELNVRTYVHRESRDPGVWFFSLDAQNPLAAAIARVFWHLPYFHAKVSLTRDGERTRYASRRRWPGPLPARFEARYAADESGIAADPESLEFFLAERYLLYTAGPGGRLLRARVHHRPYPLRSARVEALADGMVAATGLPAPVGPPHAMYSPGVDVDIYRLEAL